MIRLTLMAVFAHPDDEAFGTGGTLAKYAAQGCDVYLVTATRGEAGQIAEPDLADSGVDFFAQLLYPLGRVSTPIH